MIRLVPHMDARVLILLLPSNEIPSEITINVLDLFMMQEIKTIGFTLETNLNFIWQDAIKFYSNHIRGKGGIVVLVNPKWGSLITNNGVSPCQRVVWFIMNVNNNPMGFCFIYAPNDTKDRISLWNWLATLLDIP